MLSRFFQGVALAQEVKSGARLALRSSENRTATVFKLVQLPRDHKGRLAAIAEEAGIRIVINPKKKQAGRSLKAKEPSVSVSDLRQMDDGVSQTILSKIGQADISTSKRVAVEVNLDLFPQSYLREFLIPAIRKVKANKMSENVYFQLQGGNDVDREELFESGLFERELPQDAGPIETVSLQSVTSSGATASRNLFVNQINEGDVPAVAMFYLAIATGRLDDLSNIPTWYLDAYSTLAQHIEAETLKTILEGRASQEVIIHFALRVLTRVDINKSIQFFRNGARMTAQAA